MQPSSVVSHETRTCSARSRSRSGVLVSIRTFDSNAAVAAKAQHEPQLPWSLIGVT